MKQTVDPGRVVELAEGMKRLNRTIEYGGMGMHREMQSVVNAARYQYPEYDVQSAAHGVDSLLKEIKVLATSIGERLHSKAGSLTWAAEEYWEIEQRAMAAAALSIPPECLPPPPPECLPPKAQSKDEDDDQAWGIDLAEGFVKGVEKSVKGVFDGIVQFVKHPIDSSAAVAEGVKNITVDLYHEAEKFAEDPGKYTEEKWESAEKAYYEFTSLSDNEKAEYIGEMLGNGAVTVLGGGAIGAGVKKAAVLVKVNKAIPEQVQKQLEEHLDKEVKPKSLVKGNYSRESLGPSFADEVQSVLKKHNLSLSEFNELRLKPTIELTVNEAAMMKEIRRSVPDISSDTVMQKVVPANSSWLFQSPQEGQIKLGGFVARASDTKDMDSFAKLYEGLRLDYEKSPYIGGKSALAIRYKAGNPTDYKIPFGGGDSDALAKMSDNDYADDFVVTKEKPPFTGNGFTKSEEFTVPEYRNDIKTALHEGAELYEITDQGEQLIGVYSDDYKRFLKIDEWVEKP